MLIAHVDHIQWDDSKQAIPAFLAIVLMPFTLSGMNS
jgi:xanthine/uracil/vitamin C permease (AzgA family)